MKRIKPCPPSLPSYRKFQSETGLLRFTLDLRCLDLGLLGGDWDEEESVPLSEVSSLPVGLRPFPDKSIRFKILSSPDRREFIPDPDGCDIIDGKLSDDVNSIVGTIFDFSCRLDGVALALA